jgi:hypothetical protein
MRGQCSQLHAHTLSSIYEATGRTTGYRLDVCIVYEKQLIGQLPLDIGSCLDLGTVTGQFSLGKTFRNFSSLRPHGYSVSQDAVVSVYTLGLSGKPSAGRSEKLFPRYPLDSNIDNTIA